MKKKLSSIFLKSALTVVAVAGAALLLLPSCEKEKEEDPEVYVWMQRSFKNEQNEVAYYTLSLYGDSIKLKEYTYGEKETYCYIGQDHRLMKTVLDTAKAEVRIYRENKLISTCRYGKDNGYNSIRPTTANDHRAYIMGKDVYVQSVFLFEYNEYGYVYEKTEIVLWKNGEIIWRRDSKSRPWCGMEKIGEDLYWLIKERVENTTYHTYYLYKNGTLEKTYELTKSFDLMSLHVIEDDIYRVTYNPWGEAKVWKNDELIFEKEKNFYSPYFAGFDGDWYLVSEFGEIFKNGELLYDITGDVEVKGLYKYRSDIYCWGYIMGRKWGGDWIYLPTVWKNGKKWLTYPPYIENRSEIDIVSVFKK